MKKIDLKRILKSAFAVLAVCLLSVATGCSDSKVKCPFCQGERIIKAFNEEVPCTHCDEDGKVLPEEAEKFDRAKKKALELKSKMDKLKQAKDSVKTDSL